MSAGYATFLPEEIQQPSLIQRHKFGSPSLPFPLPLLPDPLTCPSRARPYHLLLSIPEILWQLAILKPFCRVRLNKLPGFLPPSVRNIVKGRRAYITKVIKVKRGSNTGCFIPSKVDNSDKVSGRLHPGWLARTQPQPHPLLGKVASHSHTMHRPR